MKVNPHALFLLSYLLSTFCIGSVRANNSRINDSLSIESLLTKADSLGKRNVDSSLTWAKTALDRAKLIENSNLINRAYNQLGIIYRFKGELDSASMYYDESFTVCVSMNDSFCMAKVWHNLAVLARKKGELTKALNYELKSIPVLEKSNDSIAIGHAYNSLGNIYNVQGNSTAALPYYRKYLTLQRAVHNETGEARALYNLGVTYYRQDQLDKADSLLRASLAKNLKLDNRRSMANIYHSLGAIQQTFNNYQEAYTFLQQADLLYEQLDDKEGQVYTLLGLGDLHQLQKKWELAEKSYRSALQLSTYTGLREEKLSAHEMLSIVLEKQQKYEEALHEMNLYSKLKDTLREDATGEQILELQEKYESHKKDQENLLLAQQNEIKAQELESQRQALLFQNLVVAILVVILILSILLFLSYKKRTQIERLVTQQQLNTNRKKMLDLIQEQELAYMNATLVGQEAERKRIAADLHDGLSNMMVTVKLYFENLADKLITQDQSLINKYNEAVDMLDELCKKARTIAHDMSSQQSIFNLKTALREVVEIINRTGQLKVELSMFGLENAYPASFENEVFHVLRELIGNCLKHAEANKLFIQLTSHDNSLSIIIEDDGKGFSTEKLSKQTGMGLPSLKKRIKKYKGSIFIDATPNRGTAISIELPTNQL